MVHEQGDMIGELLSHLLMSRYGAWRRKTGVFESMWLFYRREFIFIPKWYKRITFVFDFIVFSGRISAVLWASHVPLCELPSVLQSDMEKTHQKTHETGGKERPGTQNRVENIFSPVIKAQIYAANTTEPSDSLRSACLSTHLLIEQVYLFCQLPLLNCSRACVLCRQHRSQRGDCRRECPERHAAAVACCELPGKSQQDRDDRRGRGEVIWQLVQMRGNNKRDKSDYILCFFFFSPIKRSSRKKICILVVVLSVLVVVIGLIIWGSVKKWRLFPLPLLVSHQPGRKMKPRPSSPPQSPILSGTVSFFDMIIFLKTL